MSLMGTRVLSRSTFLKLACGTANHSCDLTAFPLTVEAMSIGIFANNTVLSHLTWPAPWTRRYRQTEALRGAGTVPRGDPPPRQRLDHIVRVSLQWVHGWIPVPAWLRKVAGP